jgi:FMNH2-dependent dimethyl sulfone monooxygenase
MSSVLERPRIAQPERGALPALPEDSPLGQALKQPMLLGLFLPIHNGGWSMSTTPRATDWTFEYNARLTRQAEDIGFELVFGPAHWLSKGGFGGDTRYRETSLDAFVTVAGLAAVTKRILLISTIHALYGPWHPLHLAKLGATIDHIAQGRWGVNVVTGFRKDEWAMFGQKQIEHDKRYEISAELVDLLVRLWTSQENVDYESARWKLEKAFVTPKPAHGRPILVNATSSAAGIAYAARYSDLVFVTSPAGANIDAAVGALPAVTGAVKAAAREVGRIAPTIVNPLIIVRDTEQEAREYYDEIVAHPDEGALDGFFHTHATGDSKSWRGHQRGERIAGGNVQIIGSPTQVVERLQQLKQAGCDGVQICLFDYEPELDYFGRKVVPLMRDAGLRL